MVSLRLPHIIDLERVKEGDNVYFDCKIKANPKHTKLIWKRNVSLI